MKVITVTIFALISIHLNCLFARQMASADSLLTIYKTAAEDTAKIKILGSLYNYYLYRDREKARTFATEELALSTRLDNIKGKALGHYHLGVLFNNANLPDSAYHRYTIARHFAEEINDIILIADINHAMAIQQFYGGNLEEARKMTEETIAMHKQGNDSVGLAIALDFLGMIHQNKGNYNIALNYIHEGLEIFQKVRDSLRLADTYTHLAALESNLHNTEKSIEYNLQALRIYEIFEDAYYQSQALNDIGQAYLLTNDYANARIYLERAVQKSIEAGAGSVTGTAYTNLGKLQIAQDKPERSFGYFDQALEIQYAAGETRKQIITKNQVAFAHNKLNQPQKAIPVLTEVIEVSDSLGSKSTLRYAHLYRSESYRLMADFASSLQDYEMYKTLSDTLFNREKSRQIEELRTIHDLRQKELELELQEEEIKVLNNEIRITNNRKITFAMGMVSFFIIAVSVYYGFRQRMKKNEIERRKQEDILLREIEFKKKELASQTLHLVQKNTFIQELKENLERIKNSPELFKIEFGRIVMLLKREYATNKDWEVFKSYFSEVHDDFDKKLMTNYPDISEKELRLASFIKMKLSTKEIAVMLNVLPESVLKSKFRLKKKLELEKQVDLYQYLNAL